MKDYIYNRIVQAERCINDEINACLKYRKAKDIDYAEIRKRVMRSMDCKTMPIKYKEQIGAILWFTFKREVSSKYLYPTIFNGRLYNKWGNMPKECQEYVINTPLNEKTSVRIFPWHFTEGMEIED